MSKSGKIGLVFIVLVVVAGGAFVMKSRSARLQVPAGAPPPVGGLMGGPGGDSGSFAELQKSHKYAFQLMTLVGNLGRLEELGKAPLTVAQAKSALAILEPLRKLKSLDEPTARKAYTEMHAVITDEQRAAINTLPAENQFRKSGPPPGQRPSGAPSGPAPSTSPKAGPRPDSFNPLNPPKGGPAAGAGDNNMDKLFDNLRKKSGG